MDSMLKLCRCRNLRSNTGGNWIHYLTQKDDYQLWNTTSSLYWNFPWFWCSSRRSLLTGVFLIRRHYVDLSFENAERYKKWLPLLAVLQYLWYRKRNAVLIKQSTFTTTNRLARESISQGHNGIWGGSIKLVDERTYIQVFMLALSVKCTSIVFNIYLLCEHKHCII